MSEATQIIYTYLPLTNSESMNSSKLLGNLGKPTKRGIKKCPKCGVYNGTRGMACKNRRCDAIFKDSPDKRQLNLDAVKLSGIVRQVYSVRVRDRGPDHRGFVQLPLLPSQEEEKLSETALCFVDSCQRLFDDSILKCHELEQNSTSPLCVHIDSALMSQSLAVPVEFKKDVLSTLKVSNEMKEKLWQLATEKEGPLVQRVSRTVMAVKCQVTPKHPLGYLHFTFGSTKGREIYDKYYCSCTEFMGSKSSNIRFKCIHYYACICALTGSPKLSEEFANFISIEFPKKTNTPIELSTNFLIRQPANVAIIQKSRSTKKQDKKIKNKAIKKPKKLVPKIIPVHIKVLSDDLSFKQETEKEMSWKFTDWLAHVTESINRTMQFENYGILNTLIFYIPETFFGELESRIPHIYIDAGPNDFGKIYHIMNIMHLKQIFDTVKVKLKISKRFVHDNHNGYVEYNEEDDESCQSNLIFFLNVGQSTVDESDNVNNSFIIEWVPNISAITGIGQLKLQYKYGRKSI